MGRVRRIEFDGAHHHVTTRANAGGVLFGDDLDRNAFLALVERTVDRVGWYVLTYCLMSTHYHLLVETPRANLAAGMRHLNGSYALRVNTRYERFGHVFQTPYRARLIETEEHLLEVSRYVVLNPVRAGLCKRAADWPWSSHRAVLGQTPPQRWLSVSALLERFAPDPERARSRYAAFVDEGCVDQIPGQIPPGHVPREHVPGPGPGRLQRPGAGS
jgi:REP element-mobilizing transposase RayT